MASLPVLKGDFTGPSGGSSSPIPLQELKGLESNPKQHSSSHLGGTGSGKRRIQMKPVRGTRSRTPSPSVSPTGIGSIAGSQQKPNLFLNPTAAVKKMQERKKRRSKSMLKSASQSKSSPVRLKKLKKTHLSSIDVSRRQKPSLKQRGARKRSHSFVQESSESLRPAFPKPTDHLSIPPEFLDPLGKKMMKAPFLSRDGISYDETTLIEWSRLSPTSPHPDIVGHNSKLHSTIRSFVKEHSDALTSPEVWFKASQNGSKDEMEEQIFFGIDINVPDQNGNTALHLALINKNYQIVEFLTKQRKIDCQKVNHRQELPIETAIRCDIPPDHQSLILLWNKTNIDGRKTLEALRTMVRKFQELHWKQTSIV